MCIVSDTSSKLPAKSWTLVRLVDTRYYTLFASAILSTWCCCLERSTTVGHVTVMSPTSKSSKSVDVDPVRYALFFIPVISNRHVDLLLCKYMYFSRFLMFLSQLYLIYFIFVGAKLQATNRVPRPVDRGTATRYGG